MSGEPLLSGSKHPHELKNMKVYVIQFPNPFDEKNEDLNQHITYQQARKQFFKVFKTSFGIQVPKPNKSHKDKPEKKDLNANAVPEMVKKNVPWLYSREDHDQKLSRRAFLKSVISAVLFTIQYECNLHYSLLESRDKDELFCEISADEEWLEKKAQAIGYRLQFNSNPDDIAAESLAKSPFKEVPPYAIFEIPKDSNPVEVKKLFKHFDADENEDEHGSLFTYNDRVRLIRNSLNLKLDLHIMKEFEISIEDFCLHSEDPLNHLKQEWAKVGKMFSPQPLQKIRNYFGEKAALYFAWMEMYKNFMISAGIIGLAIQIVILINYFDEGSTATAALYLQVLFALFLAFWASTFDQMWTRREKEYAWRWGTTSFYEEEEQRGEFEGHMTRDPVSNKMKRARANEWWYTIKKCISYSLIIVIVIAVMALIWSIMFLRWIMIQEVVALGMVSGGVINAIQIRVMNLIYDKIAIWLNDWENHETETEYNNRLAVKIFLFRFVNSYASLFYLAYYGTQNANCGKGECMEFLGIQLALIFFVSVLLNAIEIAIPWMLMERRLIAENMKISTMRELHPEIRENLYPVEKEAKKESYESPLFDYIEMIIEFGYVAIFSTALPILPLLLLFEIVIEVRVDAWKICNVLKRADPHRSEDIGVFKDIILVIAYVGAINNSGLIIFTTGIVENLFGWYEQTMINGSPQSIFHVPPYGTFEYLIGFVILEHVLLIGMFLISVIIPDEPDVVQKGLVWSERIINERLYRTGIPMKMLVGIAAVEEAIEGVIHGKDSDFLLKADKINYTE